VADQTTIREQADRIIASGVLGRSKFYAALLEYLVDCSERDHTPKEIEIAAEVFNRGEGFDPSQDSMVRVYAHNLRQKLQQYYAETGNGDLRQLTIPKGEYRLTLIDSQGDAEMPPPAELPGRRAGSGLRVALIVIVSVAAGVLIGRFGAGSDEGDVATHAAVAQSALWSEVTDDSLPVTLVVGDYFIFGELDRYGNVVRMVREFDVNSSRDLDEMFMLDPDTADRYLDLELTYLPTSTAFALRDIMAVLMAGGKDVRIVASSNLETAAIRQSHIVYVGYLSGLGVLSDFVFAGSNLAIGETYDELVLETTGEVFVSEAGLPSDRGSYVDYGLFSTMPGPAGNQFVFVTGMRDEGLMQTAEAVSSPSLWQTSLDAVTESDGSVPSAFEMLYEVAGMDRANLDSMIVHAAPLAEGRVTIGQLAP